MTSDHLEPPLPPVDPRERLAICWITAVAFVCRIVALHQPMRYDESVTWAYFVGQPWSTVISSYPFPNNHVLYSLLAKLSVSIAPWSPWALRLPAFLAGVAIVPLTWAVGRRFADRATALLGAALAAASTSLILYSTNARGYSLVVVIFLLMLLVADRIRRGSARRGWLTFTLLAALGLYTVPVMLYPMGAVALWLAMDAVHLPPRVRQRRIAAVALSSAGAVALAGLLYLPIVRSAGLSALAGNKFVTASPWPVFALGLPKFFAELLGTWSSPVPWWSVPLVALLALLGLRRPIHSRMPSLAIATGAWCLALLLLTHRVPFARVWLFLLPLFLLAVARGLIRVWREGIVRRLPAIRWDAAWTAMALAALVGVIAVRTEAAVRSADTGVFLPAREVAALLTPRLQSGDRVLAPIPSNGPLLYYFAERGLDTASLTLPLERARRAYLVLDRTRGQSLGWAVMVGMIDPAQFREPALLGRPGSAEVWMADRR
jgi:hypothetical protein